MNIQNPQLLEQVIRLVARTGLFFAKADGQYSERERVFVQAFIDLLARQGDAAQARALVDDATSERISLDSLVHDTRQVLAQLPPDDADVVKLLLYAFINDVVKADGDTCEAEREAQRQWCAALANPQD
ncbi:MAG: TerB family tellurite resistance protein [Muribaculaceae bacterium]|nr:TerB family tellurite resistance protein [Muribaculaceae bacterium]